MRVALAGAGSAAARGHLPAIRAIPELVLVAGADPRPDARAMLHAAAPAVQVFADAEQMLDQVECELLIVACDPAHHVELALAGLRRGCHVLCEKPLAAARAGLEVLAAESAGRPSLALAIAHQYRHAPTWRVLRQAATYLARVGAKFRLVVELLRPGLDARASSSWRADLARSGGVLADHGSHFLDLASSIGPVEVRSVERRLDRGGETLMLRAGVSTGELEMRLSTAAVERRTSIALHARAATVAWHDDRLQWGFSGRGLGSRRVAAISDRAFVDALYAPMYAELTSRCGDAAWCRERSLRSLGGARTLVDALELAR